MAQKRMLYCYGKNGTFTSSAIDDSMCTKAEIEYTLKSYGEINNTRFDYGYVVSTDINDWDECLNDNKNVGLGCSACIYSDGRVYCFHNNSNNQVPSNEYFSVGTRFKMVIDFGQDCATFHYNDSEFKKVSLNNIKRIVPAVCMRASIGKHSNQLQISRFVLS